MIFRRISYLIALQFTAFVFVLLLINGSIFLAADSENLRRQADFRLGRTAQTILDQMQSGIQGVKINLPPLLRERVRVVDQNGLVVFSGNFFDDMPFFATPGIRTITVEDDHYQLLTTEVRHGDTILGFLQIAELSRLQAGELTPRAMLYLIVSGAISALTFFVGLFFARSSLKPAEQMMERLEQFTQDASHELRTPIAALSSSLDLALRSGKHKEGIESAKEDVTQVSILVERLLELARLDKFVLQREEVDLSVLTETVVERHRGLVDGTVIIKSEILPEVTVSGDTALLRQVIGNLLSNAVKFSKPHGGTITVRLTKDKLSMEDEGVGITKDDLPHIFDRFFQAEDSRSNGARPNDHMVGRGLGLGLALVKRIVQLHGWKIAVHSKEGEGTTFTVRFKAS